MSERIAVYGCGYLGAVHAAGMAELGHSVVGVDVNAGALTKLQSGVVPFFEPGLEPVLRRNLAAGRLRFTDSYEDAASCADIHFLTVGTPQLACGLGADLRYLYGAVKSLAPLLTKPAVIFGKSTVPVGTADKLAAVVHDLAPAGDQVEIAWNPEFLREGFAVADTLHPDRLVVGVGGPESRAAEAARAVYAPLLAAGIPLIVTDLATAELAKSAANLFLATKISFINAMAEMCDHAGADVTQLADAIGYDPRIGRRFLHAGIGFGGGCLTKDLRSFVECASEMGMTTTLTMLSAVDDVNMRRRAHAVEVANEMCDPMSGSTVAVLGAAFKPNSDDVRDSPALDIAERLREMGALVRVYDPRAMDNAQRSAPFLNYVGSVAEACENVDLVLVLTEWPEFEDMHPADLEGLVAKKAMLDGRDCLNPREWRDAGWAYRSFGRP